MASASEFITSSFGIPDLTKFSDIGLDDHAALAAVWCSLPS